MPVTSGILTGSAFKVQDWQASFLRGVYRETDAPNLAVLSVPRKNGKTGLAATLSLVHLCGPEAEENGEVYSAANDRAQAAITYRAMVNIVKRVPELSDRLIIRDFDRSLEDSVTGSRYMALSADVPTKHGLSSSFIVYDELGQARDRSLFDVLETSMGARLNPLMLVISTQAPIDAHPMSELVDDIESDPDDASVFGVVYRAPSDADIFHPDVWHAANPALGTFRSLAELEASARRAKRLPSRRASFRNLYLNQRIAPDTSFLDAAEFAACAAERGELTGESCYIGLDLAKTSDLNALVAYFPESGHVLDVVWASDDMVEGATAPYQAWKDAGWLRTTPGRSVNKRAIALELAAFIETYDVRTVIVDRWGIDELERILDDEGIYVQLDAMGQGFKDMSPAVSMLEASVLERTLKHRGNPLMVWAFGNLEVDEDPAGNRKFSKKRARDKIDPMIALTMALAGASRDTRSYSFAGSVVGL